MKRLIWDLPTRLFHWLFALSFLAAFAIAQFVEKDNNVLFNLHIVFGVFAGALLLWRLVWGFIGSQHALFRNFQLNPALVMNYFKKTLAGKGDYHAGHNPGGSVVIAGILILTAGAVISGFLQSFGGEIFEEIHEILPKLVLGLAVVHILGVVIATKMHRENYFLSMITGHRRSEPSEAIQSSRPFAAMIMLVLVFGVAGVFTWGFDRATGSLTLPFTGTQIQLGEEPEADER